MHGMQTGSLIIIIIITLISLIIINITITIIKIITIIRTQIAICPNSNEIHIYQTTGDAWSRLFVLTDNDLLVSAIGIITIIIYYYHYYNNILFYRLVPNI